MSRTIFRPLAAAGAAVLLSTALVGCGSDDDDKSGKDDSSSSKALTAAEFKTQANKLCQQFTDDTENIGKDIDENSSDADVTEAIDETVARNNELIDAIAALKAPEDLQDDVASMLDSVRDTLEKLDAITSVQDLVTMEDPFTEVNQKAAALGLDVCAQD